MAKVLPFVGGVLVFLPLLWPTDDDALTTSQAGIYLFCVWGAMIILAWLLAWALRRMAGDTDPS